jgi:hypothetical protein
MNPRSDQGCSMRDGGLRLKPTNRYAPSNRSHWCRDGRSSGVLLHLTAPARTGRGGAMASPRESSNLRYRIPIAMWFLPTRSRTREEPNFHTYGGGNHRWKAGDGSVVRPTLGDSEQLPRGFSGDRNSSYGGGGSWGSFSRRLISVGGRALMG